MKATLGCRRGGWVVRAYLPKQDITGGTVNIQIIEANLGPVRVSGESKRVSTDQVKNIVEGAQGIGRPLNADSLDPALLLIGELPGVTNGDQRTRCPLNGLDLMVVVPAP